MHPLYEEWLTDQVISFAANWLIFDKDCEFDTKLFIAAGQIIAENFHILKGLSLPTLSLIASIPDGRATKYYSPRDNKQGFDNSKVIESAKALHEQLAGKGISSTAFAVNAATILQQDHISFKKFLKWAYRASLTLSDNSFKIGWNQAIWSRIYNYLSENNIFDQLDSELITIRNPNCHLTDRISALNELYRLVNEVAKLNDTNPTTQPWIRLAKDLMNRLFCWPLMVDEVGEDISSGISLPISAFLSEDNASSVYFKDGTSRYTEYVGDMVDRKLFGFNKGSLRWNYEWGNAFKVGLSTAKSLWATQNGRLAAPDKKESLLNCSLVVDLSHANAIVSRLYDKAGSFATFKLSGRSAEVYLAQVALGLMLPESSKPDGVATGKVRYEQGFYRLLPVERIREKLRYANNSGMFSRIVLPENERTKKQASEEIKQLEQARLVEINYCPSARSTADAIQASGWRRAYFFRTPIVQRSFYNLLYDLFQFDNSQKTTGLPRENADDYLPKEDRNVNKLQPKQPPLSDYELNKLQKMSAYLTSKDYTVKYCKRSDIKLSEELLGKWLAWIDHQVRGGYGGEPGPGLGVVCMRTSERDNQIRFWSALFDLLKANPRQWEKFQWADLEGAAHILASLLNNFQGDGSISYSSAPDIIIIIDDASYTQHPTNLVFPEDFRGQLFDLLNPQKSQRDYYLANALHELDLSRARILGRTRLIVIYDEQTDEERVPKETTKVDEGLRRLAIFRQSFSVQSAFAVLHHDNPHSKSEELAINYWQDIRTQLEKWVHDHHLYRHRGHYYLSQKLRRELQDSPEHTDPRLHLTAARSLAPIIEPHHLFLAGNRDRAMDPEQLAEAMWHLQEALKFTEPKDNILRPQIREAIGTLTFLRSDPDWDTVKMLNSMRRCDEAYFLAMDLLEVEKQYRIPHSSRYALAINAISRHAATLKSKSDIHRSLLDEANNLFTIADDLAKASDTTSLQQHTKLHSEYAYCLRNNLLDGDDKIYQQLYKLENDLDRLLGYLLKQRDLVGVETPVSQDWLTLKWSDDKQSKAECAKFARYACDLSQDSWDLPWLVQLALMSPEQFETPQVARILNKWKYAYNDSTEGFFRRIAGLTVQMRKEYPVVASFNLLSFLIIKEDRLKSLPAKYAKEWINALCDAATPYREIPNKQFKQIRNDIIWRICLLLGKQTSSGWEVYGKIREVTEFFLITIGVKYAWLFVLASQYPSDDTAYALPILLSYISDDELRSIKSKDNLVGVVDKALKKLNIWLKIRWRIQEYRKIEALKESLAFE